MGKRLAFALVAWMVCASAAFGQDCTPTPVQTLAWGQAGQTIVPAYGDASTNLVPPGEIWIIKAANVGYDAGNFSSEFALQLDHQWPDGSFWYSAVARTPGQTAMSPALALPRPIVLEAGERLSARTNFLPATTKMYVMALGWRLPAACLPSLLLQGVTTTAAAPADYSALKAAAQSAAEALGVLASVP